MQIIKIISIVATVFAFSFFSFFASAQDSPLPNPSFEVCQGIACNPQVSETRMVNKNGASQTSFKRGTFVRIHTNIVDPGGVKYAKAIVKDSDNKTVAIIPLYNDGSKEHGDASSYLNGSINGADDDTYSALWLAAYIFRTGITYCLAIEASDNFGHIYHSNPCELNFSLTDTYSSNCSNIGELKCVGNLIQRCFHNDNYNANIWGAYINCAPNVCCGSNPNVVCCSSGQSCAGDVCVCQDNDKDGHADSLCGGDDCDDNNPNRFPGNPEICDGIDNDCDPSTNDKDICDSDHDDYCDCSGTFVFESDLSSVCSKTNTSNQIAINNTCDCDDNNSSVNPQATEICDNNIDDNCNTKKDCADNDCAFNPNCNPNACPNTVCDPGECSSCPADCAVADCCGNGVCDFIIGENNYNCLEDCPDIIAPIIDSFTTAHNSDSVDIAWTVSDTGGSHLDRIEIWRALDKGNKPGTWEEVNNLRQTITNQNTDSNSNKLTDNSGQGIWWYGLHVIDQAGNIGIEPNPIQIVVTSCIDDCTISETKCSNDNTAVLACGDNNDGDVCLDWVPKDCSNLNQVCRINNSNTANCCSNLCNIGTDSPRCNTGNTAIETCQQQDTGCGNWGIFQNCAGVESCHLDSNGNPNCCADQCSLSDSPRCNADNTGVETCQMQDNGCNSWAIIKDCGNGNRCYEDPSPYCFLIDDDPPEIILISPNVSENYHIGDKVNFIFKINDISPLSSSNLPKVFIQFPDNNNILTLILYDDGMHSDGIANDNVYGADVWDSTGQSLGTYYVDVFAEDNKGNSITKDNITLYNLLCVDVDADGFCKENDCDDSDANHWLPSNTDEDNDGHANINSCLGTLPRDDCDDSDANHWLPSNTDKDNDGHASINSCLGTLPRDDCDDNNAVVYPGANEFCNGIDDDCDGQVDEDDVCVFKNNSDFNQGDNVNIIPNQNWLEIKPIATPYIWLASSGSDSVYRVNSSDNSVAGPFPVGVNPSRTAVAINGDVWVANRNSANVTHLDTNGALIKTCSVGSGPRGVAIDADGNVWVGNYGDGTVQKLDYNTCAVLENYTLPNPTATVSPGVYGMAVDGLGNIWMVNGRSSHRDLAKINIATKTVTDYSFGTYLYGIALDKHNNVWLADWSGQKVYKVDQSGNVIAKIPLGMNCRAIACDKDNNIWVTHTLNDKVTKLDNNGNVIFSVCTDSSLDCNTTIGAHPIGVTATASGYIWVVNYNTHIASKIDPDTGNIVASVNVGLHPYTYSDMAGYMLRTVTLGGKWTLKVDSNISNPQWKILNWNEIEPDDSYARVRVRSADIESDLDSTAWSEYYDNPPVDISNLAGHRWLQFQFDMKYSINDESPTVDNISVGF